MAMSTKNLDPLLSSSLRPEEVCRLGVRLLAAGITASWPGGSTGGGGPPLSPKHLYLSGEHCSLSGSHKVYQTTDPLFPHPSKKGRGRSALPAVAGAGGSESGWWWEIITGQPR